MEAVVRRCPFLARVSQAFLQKAGPSLLLYAQHCPRMMEAAPGARGLATSAARGQQAEEESPAARRGECGRSERGPRRRVGGGRRAAVAGQAWSPVGEEESIQTRCVVGRSCWSGRLRGGGGAAL